MALSASIYSDFTKDLSGSKRPKTVYNYSTGEHEKSAHRRDNPLINQLQRKYNPTDAKVREHLRRAGV